MKIETVPCPQFSFLKLELSIPHHPLGAQKGGDREGGEGKARWVFLSVSGSYLVASGAQPRLPEASGISDADDIRQPGLCICRCQSQYSNGSRLDLHSVCSRTDQGQAAGLRKQQGLLVLAL